MGWLRPVLPGDDLPLARSANGRYLVNGLNEPTFLRCFSAWPVVFADPDDWEPWLDYVQGNGFNTLKLQTDLTRWQGADSMPGRERTFDGISPWSGSFLSTPNTAFFNGRLRPFLDLAKSRNVRVLGAAGYYGFAGFEGNGDTGNQARQGYRQQLAALSTTLIDDWYEFLGDFCKNDSHLLWLLAGDNTPPHSGTTETSGLLQRIRDAIRAGGANQGMTAHFSFETTSQEVQISEPWLMHLIYTWVVYDQMSTSAYAANAGPVFTGEVLYRGNTGGNDLTLRRQHIRCFLGGSLAGVDFGDERGGYPGSAGTEPFAQGGVWQDAIGLPQPGWYKAAFDRFLEHPHWHLLAPSTDSTLITNGGTIGDSNYCARAVSSNGTIGWAYRDDFTDDVTLQLGAFSGPVEVHAINPTSGQEFHVGDFNNTGTTTLLRSPHALGNDWLFRIRTE